MPRATPIAELIVLANQALAGLDTGYSLSDINAAVSAVNEGFDKCRFLSTCPTFLATAPPTRLPIAEPEEQEVFTPQR